MSGDAAGSKRRTLPSETLTDARDQHRNARMRKPQPHGTCVLCVESVGWAGGECGVDQAADGLRVRYALESNGDIEL